MKINNVTLSVLLIISTMIFSSCDTKTSPYNTTEDVLVKYEKIEMVKFSISGTAACNQCTNVTGLQVEVFPNDDPMTTLVMNTFNGLGSFSFSEISYKKGAKLSVMGKLYLDSGKSSMDGETEITVPDDEGDIVACTINFQR